MRKLRVWGSGALLLAGLGLSAAVGQGRADDAPWAGRAKATAKPAEPKPETAKPADEVEPTAVRQRLAVRSAQEREKLCRRLLVCDKLHDIAERTNDQELLRLADQLGERAYSAWLQRSTASPTITDFQSDQGTLDKKLPLAPTAVSGSSGVTPNALSRRTAGRTEE